MGSTTGIKISINGGPFAAGLLDIHQEWIDASTMFASRPDPNWTFVDAQGHFHAFDDDGKLPTLESKPRDIDPGPEDIDRADDDPDNWIEHYDACRICGEEVKPERVPTDPHRMIPGRKSWTVEVDETLVRATQVSVVAKTKSRTFFGIGFVNRVAEVAPGHGRSTVIGTAELGIRTKPAKPAKLAKLAKPKVKKPKARDA